MSHPLGKWALLVGLMLGSACGQEIDQSRAAGQRGPYLQTLSPTSVIVRWRSEVPVVGAVQFGPAGASLTNQAVDASPAASLEHEVVLRGLQPETAYQYAVVVDPLLPTVVEATFSTPPREGSNAPTRIWALGDFGVGNDAELAVRDSYAAFTGERPTDVWLLLGDNAYETGTDSQYQRGLFDVFPTLLASTAMWPTIGNHDAKNFTAGEHGSYFDIFSLPTNAEAGGVPSGDEAYYSFDHGNIHFICLDSETSNIADNGPMLRWLRDDLERAQAADWKIAYFHRPPYTKGSHDSDTDPRSTSLRRHALPILEGAGVDVVLSGHSHSYERSALIDGHYGSSHSFVSSMKLDSGYGDPDVDGAYRKPADPSTPHAGAVYVVAGSGAMAHPTALDHPVMVRNLATLGSLVIDIDGNRLDGRFVDASGHIDDHFAIVKDDGE